MTELSLRFELEENVYIDLNDFDFEINFERDATGTMTGFSKLIFQYEEDFRLSAKVFPAFTDFEGSIHLCLKLAIKFFL